MPLLKKKSNSAFEHNVKAEMSAGKPQKQALAIAYSVKRKAKRMAFGGMIDEKAPQDGDAFLTNEMDSPFYCKPNEFEKVQPEDSNLAGDESETEESSGMLSRILKRIRMRQMGRE